MHICVGYTSRDDITHFFFDYKNIKWQGSLGRYRRKNPVECTAGKVKDGKEI